MSEGNLQDRPIIVAYAEDHIALREPIVIYLENKGRINVNITAKNGVELLKLIEQAEVKPDVCLIDIKMPEMDGFETVTRIRHKWPDMKILVLSSYRREEFIIRMIISGANGYLTKSSHPMEVRNAIIELTENDFYYGEHFTPKLIATVRTNDKVLPQLTEKEIQLLKLCCEDLTYAELAEIMHTSPKSVEGYRNKLFVKIGVKSKVGLAMYAIRYGYVSIDQAATLQ